MLGLLVVAVGFAVLDLVFTSGSHERSSFTRCDSARPRARQRRVGRLGGPPDPRHDERGEPHRRARRPRRRARRSSSFAAFVVIGFWAFRHSGRLPASRTRSTSPSSPPRCSAPAPGSSGGTPRRRGSSWATPARSPSAPRSPCLALTHEHRSCCSRSSAGCSCRDALGDHPGRRASACSHRRVFRMAPIHHHFELGGWPETTVIIRFWILAGLVRCARPRHLLRRLHPHRGRWTDARRSSYGLGVTGEAVAGRVARRAASTVDARRRRHARADGVRPGVRDDGERLDAASTRSTMLVPSPGVPEHHPASSRRRRRGRAGRERVRPRGAIGTTLTGRSSRSPAPTARRR